jgi:hypothetical protein
MDNPEFGREMKVTELTPRTVVILSKPGRPSTTFWFMELIGDYARFFAGSIAMTLILKVMQDGTVQDDSGLPITINEYLGDVNDYMSYPVPPTVQ